MQEQLTEELKKLLEDEPENISKIFELSNQLIKFDENNIRFSVDAAIVDRLGKELVGRHETAVAELVKNGYDADAKIVSLQFINTNKKGGTLVIDDNGEGMDRQKIIEGFMRLSSSDKLHNPKSIRYKRRKAGRKGIGRFATQRLGSQLTIISQTKESSNALKLVINWDKFLADIDLNSIANTIEEIPKKNVHGTSLIIEGLRETWTDDAIQKVYKHIAQLLQPFPLSESGEDLNIDPGFKVQCWRIEGQEKKLIVDEDRTFFEHALAVIDAHIDHEGTGHFTINSKRFDIIDDKQSIYKNDKAEKFEIVRNVRLKAYYYIKESGLLPKNLLTVIRDSLNRTGGIRLYRNGFRVLPYGEHEDDWLGLDASVRRRTYVAPHGNQNFFGFIEIIDDQGELFEEQSSREGLLQNKAFEELSTFGYQVLLMSTLRIAAARERKGKAHQKDWIPKTAREQVDKAVHELEKVVEELEKIVEDRECSSGSGDKYDEQRKEKIDEEKERLKDAFNKFKQAKEENDKEISEKIAELIDEISMLRILAGLGLAIGEFVHEIKFYQAALHSDLDTLIDFLFDTEEQDIAKRLKNHLESLKTYTAYFDKSISQNVQRELENIELRDVVRPFTETIQNDANASGITIEGPLFEGYGLYTCLMHKSEWTSILFNLYTNAKKAIKKANSNGKISIECGKTQDTVFIRFSDNGIGIPEDKKKHIFNAFYTTSTPVGKVGDEMDELRGTGLGLKILQDIVTGYGGKIFVSNPKNGYITTIQVEVPKRKVS